MSLTLQNAIEQKTKFLKAFVSGRGGGDKHRAAQREKNKTRHARRGGG